jgi:hypothetical protein
MTSPERDEELEKILRAILDRCTIDQDDRWPWRCKTSEMRKIIAKARRILNTAPENSPSNS